MTVVSDPAAVWAPDGVAVRPAPVRRPFGVRPEDGLLWFAEQGFGYYAVRGSAGVYDEEYFAKYQRYAATEQGRKITAARVELVQRYCPHASLLDIGIGCGAFVEARAPLAPTFGFDINPVGVAWLHERQRFADPWRPIDAMSFWDSLEHLQDPEKVLENTVWAFISLPIFTGPDHVLRSKHFRRDEHYWYFTREGLIGRMRVMGFECLEHNTMESLREREDIGTFVFRRAR